MPVMAKSDTELGMGDLHKVLPDSWNNIAWVVQNSFEVMKEQQLQTRRLVEQHKQYSVDANIGHLRGVEGLAQKTALDIGKLEKKVDDNDDQITKREKDLRIEIKHQFEGITKDLQG